MKLAFISGFFNPRNGDLWHGRGQSRGGGPDRGQVGRSSSGTMVVYRVQTEGQRTGPGDELFASCTIAPEIRQTASPL